VPSRKQRRRQQKLRRHEWEEVLVDEEGNEVVVEPDGRATKAKAKPERRSSNGRAPRRPIREVPPPSWNRVIRRAGIFAPLMFATVWFLAGDKLSLADKVLQTLILLAFFLPFSYVMDRVAYRAYQRRLERS
jgi:hypothetical protein